MTSSTICSCWLRQFEGILKLMSQGIQIKNYLQNDIFSNQTTVKIILIDQHGFYTGVP